MKSNAWIIFVAALALTGSILIGKTVVRPAPPAIGAGVSQVAPPDAEAELPLPQLATQEASSVPAAVAAAEPVPDAEDSPHDAAGGEAGWTVLVVRGGKVEPVTYYPGDSAPGE